MDINALTYRLFGDLKGTAGGWDMDAEVGLMYSSMSQKLFGSIVPSLAQTALNDGTYVPGVSKNGAALFAPEASDHPSSTLGVVDLHASHDLMQMPGGPLTAAMGTQYIHKAFNAQNPPTVALGISMGTTAFAVGSQDDTAGFIFEVGGKPVRQLEVDAAIRYDHYDTYGGSATRNSD